MTTVFLTVLNMSLTASYVILFLLALRLLLRRAPKLCSYALWSVALIRLLCPISFESRFSLVPTRGKATVDEAISTARQIASVSSPLPSPSVSAENGAAPATAAAQTVKTAAALSPAQLALTIAAALWLIGVAALLGCSLLSLRRLKKRLSAGATEGSVIRSAQVDSPFVLGLFRPKIYLPEFLTPEEEGYILMHERTHIRRGDHITRMLAFLALSLHWFNPLVWLAYHCSGRDMEMACDEYVLNHWEGQVKKAYSASLLSLSTNWHIPVGAPLAFGESSTGGRIRHVLNYKKPAFWVVVLAIAAALGVGAGLLMNPVGQDSPAKDGGFLTEGRTAVLTKDTQLMYCYSDASQGDDGVPLWTAMNNYVQLLSAGDIVLILEENSSQIPNGTRVMLPYGDPPALYGYVEAGALSTGPEAIARGNQGILTEATGYDAPDGNVVNTLSGKVQILQRQEGWAQVELLGTGEDPLWVSVEQLSYAFDGAVPDWEGVSSFTPDDWHYDYTATLKILPESTPEDIVTQFFNAFEYQDFDTMREYCTQEFVEASFGDGSVLGMVIADLISFETPAVIDGTGERADIPLQVEAIPSPDSALYQGNQEYIRTEFYLGLTKDSHGDWKICDFYTG